MFVMDFNAEDIIGQTPPRVIQATSWRLNTRIPRVANEYVRILEEKVLRHRLIERMGAAHTSSKSRWKLTKRINRMRQGAQPIYEECGEEVPKNKVRPNPLFTRGICVDQADSSVPISTEIPQWKDQEQGQTKKIRTTMRNCRCHVYLMRGNQRTIEHVHQAMRPLLQARNVLSKEAPPVTAHGSPGKGRQGSGKADTSHNPARER
jgi:hypothetical protein